MAIYRTKNDELYHYGVKGMKWDPNKPRSRKRNDSGKSASANRRGEGLGFTTSHNGVRRRTPGRKRFGSFFSSVRLKSR